MKRQRDPNDSEYDWMSQAYNNLCLTLDDADELCTTNNYGFDGDSHTPPYEIDFVLPKKTVSKIKLRPSFKDDLK